MHTESCALKRVNILVVFQSQAVSLPSASPDITKLCREKNICHNNITMQKKLTRYYVHNHYNMCLEELLILCVQAKYMYSI